MLDLTKPVQTRDGKKVRILCTDRLGSYPVIALVSVHCAESLGVVETLESFTKEGSHRTSNKNCDLVNITVKKWRWACTLPWPKSFVTDGHYTEQGIKGAYVDHNHMVKIESTEISE